MTKSQVDSVLRAVRNTLDESTDVIVAGSQSLHTSHLALSEEVREPRAVDLFVAGRELFLEILKAFGEGSPFHEAHGYYAEPVSEATSHLPRRWRDRLVRMVSGDHLVACVEVHDLAIYEYLANNEGDRALVLFLVEKGVLDSKVLKERLSESPGDDGAKARVERAIDSDFASCGA